MKKTRLEKTEAMYSFHRDPSQSWDILDHKNTGTWGNEIKIVSYVWNGRKFDSQNEWLQ